MTDDDLLSEVRRVILIARLTRTRRAADWYHGHEFSIYDAMQNATIPDLPGQYHEWLEAHHTIYQTIYYWMYEQKPLTREVVSEARTTVRRRTPAR
jgi:hypothetical protein